MLIKNYTQKPLVLLILINLFIAADVYAQCGFTGLSSNYCTNSAASTLTPGISGGVFSGPGVTGSVFTPSVAGPGTHTINFSVCNGTYAVSTPSFAPLTTNGTSITSNDIASGSFDDGLAPVSIGFPFQFYCTTYTTMYVGTNGFVTFSNNNASGCCNGGFLPTTGVTPDNMIAAAWVDLYPPGGGSITHTLVGTAPNRIKVVSFNAINHYNSFSICCPVTFQILLYESTNVIEIHTTSKPLPTNTYSCTMGLQNAGATQATTVTGRNASTTWTATNECVRFTPGASCSTSSVTIVSPSSILVTGSNSICAGATTSLSGSNNNTYTWTTGSSTNVISNSAGVSVSPGTTQTYSVAGTNNFGCIAQSAITVTVDQTPTVTAVSSNTNGGACPGATLILSGVGATTYTWSGPQTVTNNVAFVPTGTGTFVVTGANACGTNSASIGVSVHPLPVVGAVAATGSICSGATTTINVTGNSVTNTITSAIAGPSVTAGVGFTPVVTNTYTVKGTSILGCTATAVATVQVMQTPNLAPTASTLLLCTGNSATLSATGATGGYTWTAGSSTIGTSSTVVVNPTSTTTYSVVKNSSTCFDTKTITIQVNSLTPVFAAASSTLICASNTVGLSAFGGIGYTWYSSAAPTTSFSSSSNPIVSPSVNTTYTVAASDGTCINTAVVTVATNTNPIINVAATATSICFGQSSTLTASGANNYTWTSSPATGTANGSVLAPAFPTAGAYAFYVTGDNSLGCTATVQQIVLVNSAPSLVATANKTLVCSGGGSTLTVSGANSYQWDANANGANTTTTTVNPASNTVYNVTGTLSATGCSASTTVFVNIYTPTVSVLSPTNTCVGGAITLTGQVNNPSSGATNSYTWTGPGIPNTQGSSIVVNPTGLTVYTLSAKSTTLANGGSLICIGSNTTSVGIFYNPTVSVVPSRTYVCKGESVDLVAHGATTYTWNNGSATGATLSVINNNVGTITYSLAGTDANGCKNTTVYYLKINGCQGIKEFEADNLTVLVFPNPNNGEFSIVSTKELKVNLINELGQVVRQLDLHAGADNQVIISDLVKGIYFLVDEKSRALTGQKIIVR